MSDNQAPTRWQIYTAAKPTVERIIPELAAEIGLNESIVLLQISYWISISENIHDDTYWTYQSIRDMHREVFSYWSIATISRIIKSLQKSGYILVRNFNKRKGDKTQWFALEPDKLSSLKSVIIQPITTGNAVSNRNMVFQYETPNRQNETTLPETTTENRTQNKDSLAPEVANSANGNSSQTAVTKTVISMDMAIKRTLDQYRATGEIPHAAKIEQSEIDHQRANNPMYDAIYAVWKYTAGMNTLMAQMLEGVSRRKGYKEYNLEAPVTPDELKVWAAWYRKTELKGDPKLSMVQKRDKIQSSITYWQGIGKPGLEVKGVPAHEVKWYTPGIDDPKPEPTGMEIPF